MWTCCQKPEPRGPCKQLMMRKMKFSGSLGFGLNYAFWTRCLRVSMYLRRDGQVQSRRCKVVNCCRVGFLRILCCREHTFGGCIRGCVLGPLRWLALSSTSMPMIMEARKWRVHLHETRKFFNHLLQESIGHFG